MKCIAHLAVGKNPSDSIKLLTVGNIAAVLYGFNVEDLDNKHVRLFEDLQTANKALGPLGSHPADLFPFLSYLPPWMFGRRFFTAIEVVRKFGERAFDEPYLAAKTEIIEGGNIPEGKSAVESLLARDKEDNADISPSFEMTIKAAIASAYIAGVDTTATTLESFVLAMMAFPETQRKAQQEIDSVTRRERLPDYSDRESLPYLNALLLELLRWSCVVPLGIPHMLTDDDTYLGCKLKKGTTVIPNTWSVSRGASCAISTLIAGRACIMRRIFGNQMHLFRSALCHILPSTEGFIHPQTLVCSPLATVKEFVLGNTLQSRFFGSPWLTCCPCSSYQQTQM